MGNGIDDWDGGRVGLEEAGSAIDADGFGGGGSGEAYPAGAWGDADAFDVGEFEEFCVLDLEGAGVSVFAGERTALDGTGADDGVRHALKVAITDVIS